MQDRRIIEVWTDYGWQVRLAKEIKKGQTYRMFEPDGEPVADGAEFVAVGDPEPIVDERDDDQIIWSISSVFKNVDLTK